MTDLASELQTIEELEAGIASDQESAAHRRRVAFNLVDQLRQRIKAGETTGDPIRDFVVLTAGFNPGLVAKLQQLGGAFSAHPGELVLTASITEQFHGCTGFGHEPRDSEYQLERTFKLGRLTGQNWVFSRTPRPVVSIPTSRWTKIEQRFGYRTEQYKGSLELGGMHEHFEALDLPYRYRNRMNQPLRLRRGRDDEPDKHFVVAVGDEAVLEQLALSLPGCLGHVDTRLLEQVEVAARWLGKWGSLRRVEKLAEAR